MQTRIRYFVAALTTLGLAGCGSSPEEDKAASAGAGGGGAGGTGGGTGVLPPVPVGCVTDVRAGDQSVPCAGITHELSVPEQCLTESCGLIFDVHGGTMSGPMEDKNTQLAALGKQHGYVVVHPTAKGGIWSAAVDDPKVLGFMQDVAAAYHTDPKRLHLTGLSQGGYMSWRFLCRHSELFGSVAPAAAAGKANISAEVGCTFTGQDVPSAEMDILYLHGEQDGLVPFQNAVTLRAAVIAHYGMTQVGVVAGDATYTRTRYSTPSGRVFEVLQHDYVSNSAVGAPPFGVAIKGHCFPGSDDLKVTLPGQLMSFGCNPPNSFTWGEEVIKFFIAHPLP